MVRHLGIIEHSLLLKLFSGKVQNHLFLLPSEQPNLGNHITLLINRSPNVEIQYILFITTDMMPSKQPRIPHADSAQDFNRSPGFGRKHTGNSFKSFGPRSPSGHTSQKRFDTRSFEERVQEADLYQLKNMASPSSLMKEMRQEYEILKGAQIKSLITNSPKHKSSLKEGTKNMIGIDEYHKVVADKKDLQVIIANSMAKIEELLQKEINCKRQIADLRMQIDGKGGIHSSYDKKIKKLVKRQQELMKKVSDLENELQRAKLNEPYLQEKNQKLSLELELKSKNLNEQMEKRKQLQQQIKETLEQCRRFEYESKQLKMLMEVADKSSNNRIEKLQEELNQLTAHKQSREEKKSIRALEEKLRLKDQQIHKLMMQLKTSAQYANKVQTIDNSRSLDNILKQIAERKGQYHGMDHVTFTETITTALNSLNARNSEQNEGIKNELLNMKKQIEEEISKSQVKTKTSQEVREYQEMLKKMEHDLKGEINEKTKYYNELILLRHEFQQSNRLNKSLHEQLESKSKEEDAQKEEEYVRVRTESQRFRTEINTKDQEIRRLNSIISELEAKLETKRQEPKIVTSDSAQSKRLNQLLEENKNLKQRLLDAEHSLNRSKKESTLAMQMLQKQLQMQIKNIKRQADHYYHLAQQNQNQYKILMSQSHLKQTKAMETKSNQVNYLKDQLNKQKYYYEQQIKQSQQSYQSIQHKLENLYREIPEYRKTAVHFMKTNEQIDALWAQKESQYAYIDAILEDAHRNNTSTYSIMHTAPANYQLSSMVEPFSEGRQDYMAMQSSGHPRMVPNVYN